MLDNEAIELRKGDIVRIVQAIQEIPLRVTVLENITTNVIIKSKDEGIIMTRDPVTLPEPIVGKVMSSTRGGNNVTSFVIEEVRMKIMYSLKLERSKRAKKHSSTY